MIKLFTYLVLDKRATPEDMLTHCRLAHTIYWKSPISILGRWGYEI